jgi:pyruvate dehydrogenase E2 component (dihydrolipoamide acetyltransferase)
VPTDVIMPALGMAQETGKVVSWLKAEGEPVTKGEPLLEIETDKVTVEIEAPATGTLARVTAAAGADVPVGRVIAVILGAGEPVERHDMPADEPHRRAQIASPVAARIAAEHNLDLQQVDTDGRRVEKADVLALLAAQSQPASAGRTPASPKARRLAAERGIAIAAIGGSGPGGAVLAADVFAATTALPASVDIADDRRTTFTTKDEGRPTTGALPSSSVFRPSSDDAPSSTRAITTAWRIMAERTAQSWASAPHFYLLREVDASRLITWRESSQKRSRGKLTYTDLLVKLAAAALCEHPRLNAAWRDGTIAENSAVNIGLAVAVEDGLLVPVIHRADELSLREIAERRNDLVGRAQAGRLWPEDMQGGTFTISNLGMYGVDAFNAIVNPPQAAILAVGRIAERVVPVNGRPAVRPTLVLSLSCDHRVVDGARGAQFLDRLANLVEEPLGIVE